ncbi:TrkA family potassium uptake protein [bacterium]|nr:TrkA family potassium uptake protein [bacterium]
MATEDKYVVIGLGRFGTEVALWLAKHHFPVLAVDTRRQLVDQISAEVDQALALDSTNETALLDARIHEMTVAVCAIGDNHIEDSIMTTALLHQVGVPRIISRASTELHARILRVVGATEVVNPEKEMGVRTAQRIAHPVISELIPLAEGAAVAELVVPESFIGYSLAELRLRSRYGVNLIGIRRFAKQDEEHGAESDESSALQPHQFILNPSPTQPFERGDILVLVGSEDNVKRLASLG